MSLINLRPKNFNKEQEIKNKNSIKSVKNLHGFKKIKNCPICLFNKKKYYIKKENINYSICERCDLVFSEEQPRDLNDVYSNNAYLSTQINAYDKTRKFRIKNFAVERIKILKKYKKKGSLLDFGCGTGWFLEEAQKHYKVAGVEYSDSIRLWLKKKFNISSYKKISNLKKKFDIITAFDVIEHVPNPLVFLKSLKKKLKKNGIILIYTPNVDSLGFSFLKEKNNLLCVDHLFYFNQKSFKYMCNKSNMKIIETQFKGLDIGDIYGLMNRNNKVKTSRYIKKNFEKLQKFIDKIDYSNHMRFIIKKNN
jgi:2-polyprenyl-3-methyl-5-hydroxy-6-metoxy-1,4-benzoquinol methylase